MLTCFAQIMWQCDHQAEVSVFPTVPNNRAHMVPCCEALPCFAGTTVGLPCRPGMHTSHCALCAEELTGQHPRYVLNFEQCSAGSCLRRFEFSGHSAPLPLPGAGNLQLKHPTPSGRSD